MEKQRLLATVGIITMLAITGVGCKDISKKTSNDTDSSYSSTNEDKGLAQDNYNKAPNVEVEGNANTDFLQEVIEEVFGDVKITSFMQNFPTQNSLSAEFQTKREIKSDDINKMTAALKNKGYTIEFSGVADSSGTISAFNKNNIVWISFEIGSSKVGSLITPKEEVLENDEK